MKSLSDIDEYREGEAVSRKEGDWCTPIYIYHFQKIKRDDFFLRNEDF